MLAGGWKRGEGGGGTVVLVWRPGGRGMSDHFPCRLAFIAGAARHPCVVITFVEGAGRGGDTGDGLLRDFGTAAGAVFVAVLLVVCDGGEVTAERGVGQWWRGEHVIYGERVRAW